MHVLVTGGMGFIGSHLCDELLRKGYDVTVLSRTTKGSARINRGVHNIKCDITDEIKLRDSFESTDHIDGIFHLAAKPFSRHVISPSIYFNNNFVGTVNILEMARIFGIQKFVFGSTYHVYGVGVNIRQYISGDQMVCNVPIDETQTPRPCDPYGLSKYYAEEIIKYYAERYAISSSILRYSKVYGPGLKEGLVYDVIRKALAGTQVEVIGDISTDLVFVDDVVKATIAAFRSLSSSSRDKTKNDTTIYNISSGREDTVKDVCKMILKIVGSSSAISYQNNTRLRMMLDVSKARRELGLDVTELEEGIKKCLLYVTTENSRSTASPYFSSAVY